MSLDITIYDTGGSFVTIQRVLDPLRRGGIALRDLGLAPDAPYAIVVHAADGADILAALSSYSLTDGSGFTALGWTPSSSGASLFPAIEFRDSVRNRLVLFNLSTSEAQTATIRITFSGSGEPVERSYVLDPLKRRVVDLDELRSPDASGAVVRLDAGMVRGFVESVDSERGDSVATSPGSSAFTNWAFADGFLDRNTAGSVGFETLALFNPSEAETGVQTRFLFTDGTFADR